MKPFERDLPLIRLLLQALILFCGEHLFQILLTAISATPHRQSEKQRLGYSTHHQLCPSALPSRIRTAVIPAGRKSQVLVCAFRKICCDDLGFRPVGQAEPFQVYHPLPLRSPGSAKQGTVFAASRSENELLLSFHPGQDCIPDLKLHLLGLCCCRCLPECETAHLLCNPRCSIIRCAASAAEFKSREETNTARTVLRMRRTFF